MTDSTIKTHHIPFYTVANNQKVIIVDYTTDSTLIKVGIIREKSTITNPRYEEIWLWEKFVSL